ncbi:MAG: hypothetical protein J5633_02815 [Oscillospiraceae bacterium]|nr:hypothetical protein [Oscillospiraceae bacterium]
MVDTVASRDANGYVTYAAAFGDPEFEAQTRTIYDADDVVKKWDFETASNSSEWTLSGFVRNNSNVYYRERIGRSGEYYLLADDKNNLSPKIYTSVTLPENACLTFWAAGGCCNWAEHNVMVLCGESLDSMEQVFSTKLKYQMDGEHYDDVGTVSLEYGLDPNQYFVDLSAYSGKQVYLQFAVTISGESNYTEHTILIDDVELRSAEVHFSGIPINETNFPNAVFLYYVDNSLDKIVDDGLLDADEIAAATGIDVSYGGIDTLQGIEYFTALHGLYCKNNHLTTLDLSQNTALEVLECENNWLTSLDVSKCTALKRLICYGNSIAALDISACPELVNIYLNGTCTETSYGGVTYDEYTLNGKSLSVDKTTTVIAAAPPVISSVKANKSSPAVGEKITWTCTADGGTGDLQYYFILYKDGTKFKTRSYSTKKTYSYTPTEAGTYKVKVYVKDAAGSKVNKTSKGVTVIAVAAPVITTQPKAQTAAAGETATFKVVASGTGLTYQWQYKTASSSTWKDKSGATKASYTVTAKESYNGIQYRCVVSNAGGSVTSSAATLTVTSAVSKPEITTQPKAQTAAAGETATFKVVASGTGLTYQWQYSTDYGKTWHDKAGSTKATHTVTVKASYNGYLYRCKVTNSAGTVTSSKVRLTVSGVKPKILSQPAAASAAAGESVTFKVVAAGVGMTYQWQYKTAGSSTWKDKSGATSASYTTTANTKYNGIQYRCVVTNSIGSVTSDPAVLTVK